MESALGSLGKAWRGVASTGSLQHRAHVALVLVVSFLTDELTEAQQV